MDPNTKTHIKSLVHNVDVWLCTECKKWFSGKSNLTKHVRKYTYPHFQVLTILFGQKKRVHDKLISYSCAICKKGFYDKFGLEKHTGQVHVGKRDYSCLYCAPTSFRCHQHLANHMHDQHGHPKGKSRMN